MPVLAQGDLRPLDALPAEFPIGVQPVGIADHDDQAVLGMKSFPSANAVERQVFGLGELCLDLLQARDAREWEADGLLWPCPFGEAFSGLGAAAPGREPTRPFFMECQPGTFFRLAIDAKSLTVRLFRSAAVITTLISASADLAGAIGASRLCSSIVRDR